MEKEVEDLIPTEYILSQNHPNPFKERTVIKYCIPEEVNVRLEIYDYKMKKVKTLVDETKEPGTYQVEFNPNGFDEGIYLYQLTAGSVVFTKKMLLLK